MIQPRSHLTIVDNSGAKYAQCIRVLKKKNAQVGDLIVVSLKKIKVSQSQKLKVKKGQVCKALLLRTKTALRRKNGSLVLFSENAAVLLNPQKKLIGSRIFGPSARELRQSKHLKIISMLSYVA